MPQTKSLIIAFAFGAPANIRSNERIAEIASQKASRLNALIYTQEDVPIKNKKFTVVRISQKREDLPPTLRIARGAVLWAKEHGVKELWIVAAPPHLPRVLRDLKEALKESETKRKIKTCQEVAIYSEEEWFCKDSTQKRTQSLKNWERRERTITGLPFFIYKRIAN